MNKVITYGTFDLLHYGHIKLLERAKALGDFLIVAVTSDDYDKSRGKINNQQSLIERIESIKATNLADQIIVEEYDGQKIDDIKKYGVDIFAVGSDWEGKFDYLNEYCKVIYLPRTKDVSSSQIRSSERKVKLEVLGDTSLGNKIKYESEFINGIEWIGTDVDINNADAIYVVSAPEKHYQHILDAINHKKNILCESPIAIDKNQCEHLFSLAKENNVVLMESIKTAYCTAYERMILLAKTGLIGDIISIDATCTSMREGLGDTDINKNEKWNSICAWGPTGLLPIFQLLGTKYQKINIVSKFLDKKNNIDAFTKIDFVYSNAVASIKVAKGAKSEGEMVITGTKGYIYIPAPWWKTDYFEVRYEDPTHNKKFYYQSNGEGIREELLYFVKTIQNKEYPSNISNEISVAIAEVMQMFYNSKNMSILI